MITAIRSFALAIAFVAATASTVMVLADDPSYVSAAFGSVGYLYPLGIRTDNGCTFGRYLSLGLNLSSEFTAGLSFEIFFGRIGF